MLQVSANLICLVVNVAFDTFSDAYYIKYEV